MDQRIIDLLSNLEFHEAKDKPGLYHKNLDQRDACGKVGITAFIDFRRNNNKGRRFYTAEGIDGFCDSEEDVNTIPVLQYFKQKRDEMLGIKSEQPKDSSIEEHHITKPTPKTTEIQPSYIQSGFVEPAGTLDRQIEIFKQYEEAKSKLLSDNDVLWIGNDGRPTTKGKGHPHIKRSGWRKLARFFGLSCEIVSKERVIKENGEYLWVYRVIVSHPSGAVQHAEGVSSSLDSFFTKGGKVKASEEDIMLKAQTVAFNRAISDLLGGGEVSAEELGDVR